MIRFASKLLTAALAIAVCCWPVVLTANPAANEQPAPPLRVLPPTFLPAGAPAPWPGPTILPTIIPHWLPPAEAMPHPRLLKSDTGTTPIHRPLLDTPPLATPPTPPAPLAMPTYPRPSAPASDIANLRSLPRRIRADRAPAAIPADPAAPAVVALLLRTAADQRAAHIPFLRLLVPTLLERDWTPIRTTVADGDAPVMALPAVPAIKMPRIDAP